MFGLGAPELLVVLAILILLFGAKKIPDLSRSMGQSIRSFKKGMKEDVDLDDDPKVEAGTSGDASKKTADDAAKAADEAKRLAEEAAKAAEAAAKAADDAAKAAAGQ